MLRRGHRRRPPRQASSGATGGRRPARARRRTYDRVPPGSRARTPGSCGDTGRAAGRAPARSSSRWTLSTSAAPRARAARATCPGPPERSSTVRPSRSMSSSAGTAGVSSRPVAGRRRPAPLPRSRAARRPGGSRAPPRARSAAAAEPAPPARARPSRSRRACRLRARPPGAAHQRRLEAPDVDSRQEPAVSRARADPDARRRSRRRLAHRSDADEPAASPDLDGERARRARPGPIRARRTSARRQALRRPAARCPP